jgi:osmoprotectant transport system permease protein
MDWVWRNLPKIWDLAVAHTGLSVLPIVIGFVLSIPLGYWASRSPIARSALLTLFSVLYTLPSIVLFVVVPIALGLTILDPRNVIYALTIYALAIMVRSASDAFLSVPDSVRESARAVGFSPLQRFFAVELPLAGPVLLAGIRVVSVSTVSLVTIGSFIGVNSLGDLFRDGFNREFPTEVWAGVVGVLIIAGVFDVVLSTIARLLMPWNRRVSKQRELSAARKAATA